MLFSAANKIWRQIGACRFAKSVFVVFRGINEFRMSSCSHLQPNEEFVFSFDDRVCGTIDILRLDADNQSVIGAFMFSFATSCLAWRICFCYRLVVRSG